MHSAVFVALATLAATLLTMSVDAQCPTGEASVGVCSSKQPCADAGATCVSGQCCKSVCPGAGAVYRGEASDCVGSTNLVSNTKPINCEGVGGTCDGPFCCVPAKGATGK